MADRDVELDTLLPRPTSPTTSDHGEQPAASFVQPPTADRDVLINELPPLPPSGQSSNYEREQTVSDQPAVRAPSPSARADPPLAPQPSVNALSVELISNKLQSMIGLLQETVNALSQGAAAGQTAKADTACLQEVVAVGSGGPQGPFVWEKVEAISEEVIAAHEQELSRDWKHDREWQKAGVDSWKNLWPETGHSGPKYSCFDDWPCARNERITLQLQLLGTMSNLDWRSEPPQPAHINDVLYVYGPSISAIGINVAFYSGMPKQRASPQCSVKILVEILWQLGKGPCSA